MKKLLIEVSDAEYAAILAMKRARAKLVRPVRVDVVSVFCWDEDAQSAYDTHLDNARHQG